MERSTRKHGLINLLALLVIGVAGFAVAGLTGSPGGQVATVFIGIGVLVAAISWFQMGLEERERLEKLEFDELARSKGSSALFESKEADVFPARRSREQFERFFVPAFVVLLLVLEGVGAFLLWRWVSRDTPVAPPQQPMVAMTLFALCALVLFLIGKFSATIARLEDHRLLRPGASFVLLNAYVCAAVAVGLGLIRVEMPRADLYVARGLCVLLALLALETLLNLILEIYRPRLRGRVARPLYESRLIGLLAHPEDLYRTAAHAVDYQFGFKVSETWAYQMVVGILPLFILGLGCAALLSSCFVFVDPGEQVLVERFGRSATAEGILGPGPHLKLPWPMDRAYRFDTGRVQSFNVGFVPDPAREKDQTIVWTLSHYKEEYNLLVASRDQQFFAATNQPESEQAVPVNLLVAGIPVQYRITNVLAWAYVHADPEDLLQQVATREIVRYFAGVDVLEIMSVNREKAAGELRNRIQARAAELNLGADVLFVGLQDIHPPVSVASAFEDVNAAAQEVEAKMLRAEGETNRTVLLARSEALEKVRGEEALAERRITSAAAQASRFTNQIAAYRASPSVYSTRIQLQTLARATANARKFVIGPTNTLEIIQLNLEQAVGEDLIGGLTVRTNR